MQHKNALLVDLVGRIQMISHSRLPNLAEFSEVKLTDARRIQKIYTAQNRAGRALIG